MAAASSTPPPPPPKTVAVGCSGGCALPAALLSGAEHRRERVALSVGHRPDGLLLGHGEPGEELVAAGLTPAALAHQQVGHGHALRLPRTVDDHLGDVDLAERHPALELGAG